MANPTALQGVHSAAWAALALLTGLTATAQAQEQGLPLWELGVFAGGLSSPAYPASSERSTRALVLPTFIYRGEVFRSDRGGVGARLLRTEDTELDIGFAASLPASSQDIPARQGMTDLGTLIEFGPRLKGTLARPSAGSRLRYELPLRTVLDRVEQQYQGQVIKVEFERDDGRFVYEIRLLQSDGKVVKLEIDAGDGSLISMKRKK